MTPRFNIGDKAWEAQYEREEAMIECPDCAGKRAHTIILGNGEQLSIQCSRCGVGYNPSTGMVPKVTYKSKPVEVVIAGMNITADSVEYSGERRPNRSWRSYRDEDLFDNESDATRRAEERCAAAMTDDLERRECRKDGELHDWSFTASYHKRQANDLRRRADIHEAKINYAKMMAEND